MSTTRESPGAEGRAGRTEKRAAKRPEKRPGRADKRTDEAAGTRPADLVLEGGGVKGIGLVGAVGTFAKSGYGFRRIAGTSAGALVGAVVAGLQVAGEPLDRLEEIARTLDYRRFRDRGRVGNVVGEVADRVGLGLLVDGMSLAAESGMFEGKYLHDWMAGVLKDLGVTRFGDLRLPPDPGSDLPDGHRYRLVVLATDVSRQRTARLPWDYPEYGLDPDDQPVADAVRASASIPYFFEPYTLRAGRAHAARAAVAGRGAGAGDATLVDGGLLWNFPITIFDRTDGTPPRWPTFGVRLSSRPGPVARSHPVRGPVALTAALVETLLQAHNLELAQQPCSLVRTTFVDSSAVSAIDFDVTSEQQDALLAEGAQSAREFLRTWDFDQYVTKCRGGPQ
ncbi:patatin-like phospholipase family protein [Actinopolymorpha sp. NPDC004070]|uniref:patatin-like phospholipase family protein n=1 Tax=Actinopolymorpha sp. NPDC004070 TaxID=3154548 RepID=UPI0033BB7888